jgi:peptide/nickel transport system substrate-binding protein
MLGQKFSGYREEATEMDGLMGKTRLSRRRFLLGLGLGLGAVVAACRPTEPGGVGREGGTLTYAAKSDAFTLNPLMHTDTTTHTILGHIFEPPLTMGREGKFVGVLAEKWELLNNSTVRLTLRRNVRFHNGEELTAEAVKASLNFVLDPAVNSPARPTFEPVIGAEVVDAYTVDIKLRQPYAAYTTVLSFLWVIPPRYFRETGPDGFARKPVGTGPFKFVEWQKDVRLVVEANADYWRGRPELDRVVYRPIPEDSARIAALQTGEIDLAFAVPVDRVGEVEGGRGLRVAHRPGQMIYIGLDTLKFEPFKDRRVRQALNYAVDVDGIVKNLFGGRAIRLNGPFFPVTPGYDPSISPYPYDPARARALLAAAGYPDGFEVRLDTPVGIQAAQRLKEVAEVVAENLKQVKISVKIQILEPAAAFDKYRAREFQMYIFPWASSPESGRHLHTLFHSKTRGYYYQNPEADRLLDLYMATLDPDRRAAVGRQLLLFLREDAPWVFMYVEPDIYGLRDRVDWEPNQYDFRFQAYEARLKA